MAITYTPTTNFGAKDSLPTNDPDKVIKGSEFTTEFTAIQTAFSLAAPVASPTFTGTVTIPTADINGGTIDATSIGLSSKGFGGFNSLEVSALTPSLLFTETDVTDKNTKFFNSAGNFFIQEISNDGLTSVNRIKLDHTTGNMTFYDDTSAGTVLFLDAVNNRAGINTINPASTLDVNGTVTADGLTVDGSSSGRVTSAEFKNNLNAGGTEVAINLANQGGTSNADVNLVANRVGANFGSDFYIETSDGVDGTNRKRLNIGENGDISFYEDTGTTAKLFWDASAERLGVGTTSPVSALDVSQSGDLVSSGLSITRSGANRGSIYLNSSNDTLNISRGATGAIAVDASGNVGIGTSSPASLIDARDSSGTTAQIRWGRDGGVNSSLFCDQFGTTILSADTGNAGSGSSLQFHVDASEAMRIDSSGNLLVGKPASDTSSAGHELRSGSFAAHTVDGDVALNLRRLNSDGDIARFQKDGTTVGSIGTDGTTTYFAGASKALKLEATRFIPRDSDDTSADATVDLGGSVHRFKDLYLSGGAYLGGTGAANKLDDYEEGTFTATLRGSTGEPGTLITDTGAKYVKVGNIVSITISIENVSTTGYTGNVTIEGLPFAATSGNRAIINIATYGSATWTSGNIPVGVVNSNSTDVDFLQLVSGSAWQNIPHDPGSGSRYFWVTGTYVTN